MWLANLPGLHCPLQAIYGFPLNLSTDSETTPLHHSNDTTYVNIYCRIYEIIHLKNDNMHNVTGKITNFALPPTGQIWFPVRCFNWFWNYTSSPLQWYHICQYLL